MLILITALGLAVGSFIAALSWRLPRGISVAAGRSKCPKCGKTIAWYDNFPLFSYIALAGKCRYCKKKISIRYPLIEGAAAAIFALSYLKLPTSNLPYLLAVFSIALAILVIDFEHMLIPDELVFVGLAVALTSFSYSYLFTGLLAALFLLLLHLATRGRGMGLGDVKLAIFLGAVAGPLSTLVWMFLAFVIGALVGIALIIARRVKFGQHISFGPFMIIGFFLTILFGPLFDHLIFPFL